MEPKLEKRYIKCKQCKYNVIGINEVVENKEKALCVKSDGTAYEYVVDLKEVPIISSCFISTLLEIKRTNELNVVKLLHPNKKILEILQTLGIKDYFIIE